ncbi:hypothetical protein THAOC_05939 [Thalassiosira oceanica]|uniref:MYND-type domain-containing protein n=1 Tax=Thalassiosira oceanica TaxID=159749 RepID=K0T1K1_THAOC|nr:hypothetical protein THAOC_05939 [Thalassiosira oceanica]|eukprot:EJK72523.1 hypothetical protein THAOC_05939 [Thalassiosira oceanica]
MIRNIVELVGLTSCYLVGCRDCVYILGDALSASDDHHGSRDRRMSIAVDTGLIELILKMVEDEDDGEDAISDALKWIVDLLEQGATRGSKLCLSIARVDVEELMQLSVVDVDGSFSHRIKQLVESARELCTRTCTCCAASLGVGRIFRCDKCGTVYCSRVCQTKDWTKGGHKKTCSGYDGGHNGRGGYDRGAPQVIAAYGARSTLRTLEELIALQDGSMFEDSEDNDSRFSDDSVAGGIQVEGCGLSEINGYFRRVGFHDDCPKFCKMTTFRGREEVFSLFRCRLTDNTRRWYISIVPMNSQPGTTKDVDFYAAPALSHDDYPPAKSWMSVPHGGGIDPPPTLTFAI